MQALIYTLYCKWCKRKVEHTHVVMNAWKCSKCERVVDRKMFSTKGKANVEL